MDCKSFEDWCGTVSDSIVTDLLERLSEGAWSGDCPSGVAFWNRHLIDALNAVVCGVVEVAGDEWEFVMESGNNAGDVMIEWGEVGSIAGYQPPECDPLAFVPTAMSAVRLRVYHAWRKEDWFREKERAMAYDMHFDPSQKTRGHYADWASSKGLFIGHMSDIPPCPPSAAARCVGTSDRRSDAERCVDAVAWVAENFKGMF